MFTTLITENANRLGLVKNLSAEDFMLRLSQGVNRSIMGLIRANAPTKNFTITTRHILGYNKTDDLFYEIQNVVRCQTTGHDLPNTVRLPISEDHPLYFFKGLLHHYALKADTAQSYSAIPTAYNNVQAELTTQFKELFKLHTPYVAVYHSKAGSSEVTIELIQKPSSTLASLLGLSLTRSAAHKLNKEEIW